MMMDETKRDDIHVLAAQVLELTERLQTAEDAIVNLHSRLLQAEEALMACRNAMVAMTDAIQFLLGRRKPPAGPMPPLSNMN
jgi:chromosome segregation ATPase